MDFSVVMGTGGNGVTVVVVDVDVIFRSIPIGSESCGSLPSCR